MGDRYVLGFAPALGFLRSQILCRLYKSPSDETINRGPSRAYMRICMQKRSDMHVKDPVVISGFGGLWKHQINPACTKKCQSLHKSLYKLASKLQLVPKYPNCHKRFLVSQTTYVLTLRCYFSCTRTAEVIAEGHVQLMFGQQVGVREIRIETTKRTKLSNAL